MTTLPAPLHDLQGERDLLEQALDRLAITEDAVERADLAEAIALLGARYENVMEEALYPVLSHAFGPSAVTAAEQKLDAVRTALKEMRSRTRHVKAINAHVGDPDGFEAAITAMADALRALLTDEDAHLIPLAEMLYGSDVDHLVERTDHALARVTSLPDPPRHAVLRRLASAKETVDLALHDESTTWHPGLQKLGRGGGPAVPDDPAQSGRS